MKTALITTFAIAAMVFAFNTTPAEAWSEYDQCRARGGSLEDCRQYAEQIDELKDPDQAGNERNIADSGDEGSTSAASAGDQ